MGTSVAAERLLSLAVAVTSEQRVESVLQSIVQGLASQPGVVLARIWLLPSADLTTSYRAGAEPSDYLCLVASAGTPINSPGEDWCFLQGHFARMSLNVGKVGQVAASRHPILIEDVAAQNEWIERPEWAKREEIRSFAGHPLIFRDKLLGVIAVFSRQPLGQQEFTWLGLFANQAALAIANAVAEEALQSGERNLRLMINAIPTHIQVLSTDGSVLNVNQAVLDYTGLSLEDVRKEDYRARIFHPEDVERLREERREALTRAVPFENEQRVLGKDGKYRWFLVRYNPLLDEHGRIDRWYVAATDIEDRKSAEEALNRARSELAHVTRVTTLNALTASMAHEINQPLASLVTNASISFRRLNADPPNVDGARETLQRTIRDANGVSDVITRLRTLFSKKELALEPLDLNEAAQEVIALSLSDLQRNRVILRSELAENLPPAIGDRVQLQQVILNLLRNASDAMTFVEDRPRELLIKTERDEQDQVRLTVKDVGVGFTPEAAAKLFQAFYTTKRDGMGIGLSLSHSIIDAHHGRLWAQPNDGPGATFSFSVPCGSESVKGAAA